MATRYIRFHEDMKLQGPYCIKSLFEAMPWEDSQLTALWHLLLLLTPSKDGAWDEC